MTTRTITTLTAAAETTLVVDVQTDADVMQVGTEAAQRLVTSRGVRFHWSSELPLGPMMSEPSHLLHVPGQLGAGNSYVVGLDAHGFPATR